MAIAPAPAAAPSRPVTADELLVMASDARYELIEGKLVPMAPAGEAHGGYTYDLGWEIGAFVRAHRLGRCFTAETGFLVASDPDTVLAPDFAFVPQERLTGRLKVAYSRLVPDLVIETRSPRDRLTAMRDKIALWLQCGVRMALLLDPIQKTLTVYRPNAEPLTLTANDTLDGGDVLPGFTLPLRPLLDPV